MLDLHGNLIKENDYVVNHAGYLGQIILKEGHLCVKYESGHCFYLSEDIAAGLEVVTKPELWLNIE